MKKYLLLWKDLKEEFENKDIIDAFFGAFIYSFILAIPLFLAMAQIISVYMYRLNLWIFTLLFIVLCLNYLLHRWWKKALHLKKPNITTDLNILFLYNQIIIGLIGLVICFLFIFVFVPLLMV